MKQKGHGLGRALREGHERAVVEVELDPVAAAAGAPTQQDRPGGGADRRADAPAPYVLASSFFRVVVARFAGARLVLGLGFGFGSAKLRRALFRS